ncbi:MAG: MFS transporter, partial [candidate division Zixibacteria bacterium]|nr:MFS transporter [candidate division Zixibacteria bacterium]
MSPRYRMFAVAGLAAFIATFESSSINVALPTISRSFGTNLNGVSWVILAYTLTIGPTLLLFAKLSARIGIKPVYLAGFSLFLIGCLVCGLAGSFNMLVSGRVCQGLGASMIISLGPAVITRAFPKGERGKGMGLAGMVVG